MSEAVIYKEAINQQDYTPAAAVVAGEVVHLADGRAGVVATDLAASAKGAVYTAGIFTMAKTATMVLLDGQKVYWDVANSKVKYKGDFLVGVTVEDAASAATTVKVALNVELKPVISLEQGEWVKGVIDGLGVTDLIGAYMLSFDAVAEAAMAAVYSVDTIATASLPIIDALVAIYDKGDNAALDVSIGLANGSNDTDFDSVTEAVLFHIDGASANILCESDDGTTEVAATDSTVDLVDNQYHLLQIDCRELDDIQMYIDGVNVLPASVFKLDAATGPVFPIVHIEKTSDDTVADVRVKQLDVRRGLIA